MDLVVECRLCGAQYHRRERGTDSGLCAACRRPVQPGGRVLSFPRPVPCWACAEMIDPRAARCGACGAVQSRLTTADRRR